ncbi:potassium channel family protein [Paenibacillus rhizoplanae]
MHFYNPIIRQAASFEEEVYCFLLFWLSFFSAQPSPSCWSRTRFIAGSTPFYWVMTTMATVGYGDYFAATVTGKVFTIFLIYLWHRSAQSGDRQDC